MRFALWLAPLFLLSGCKQPVDYQTRANEVAKELQNRTTQPSLEKLSTAKPPLDITPGPQRFDPEKVVSESAKLTQLRTEDLVPGSGPVATDGKQITVHYIGRLPDGFIFDTSMRPGGRPYTFKLGAGTVIKGWDIGLKGMKVGGVRRLYVPADLAYGSNTNDPTRIPPNAALIFDVNLLFVGDVP